MAKRNIGGEKGTDNNMQHRWKQGRTDSNRECGWQKETWVVTGDTGSKRGCGGQRSIGGNVCNVRVMKLLNRTSLTISLSRQYMCVPLTLASFKHTSGRSRARSGQEAEGAFGERNPRTPS